MMLKGSHLSEEHKKKISQSLLGNRRRRGKHLTEEQRQRIANNRKPVSEETCKKISQSLLGNKNTLGHKLSEDHKRKIAESSRGRKFPNRVPSEEHKRKIGMASKHMWSDPEFRERMHKARLGRVPPNKGKKLPAEACEKISNSLRGNKHLLGHHHTEETKKLISEKVKGKPCWLKGQHHSEETKQKLSAALSGEKCYLWKGGISFEPYCPKFNRDLKRRIRAFFEYRCMACGKSTDENGKQLSCHHVEYNKQACCDGKPVHFAALCIRCHMKTNNDRERWESMLHRIIDEIYGSRSYYTKDEYKELISNEVVEISARCSSSREEQSQAI